MRNSEAKPINQINNTNKVKLTAFNSNYQRNRNKINIEDSSDNKIIKMNKRIK
jgi:hypothetical protein